MCAASATACPVPPSGESRSGRGGRASRRRAHRPPAGRAGSCRAVPDAGREVVVDVDRVDAGRPQGVALRVQRLRAVGLRGAGIAPARPGLPLQPRRSPPAPAAPPGPPRSMSVAASGLSSGCGVASTLKVRADPGCPWQHYLITNMSMCSPNHHMQVCYGARQGIPACPRRA